MHDLPSIMSWIDKYTLSTILRSPVCGHSNTGFNPHRHRTPLIPLDWVYRHTGFTKQYIEDMADVDGDFLVDCDSVCTYTVNGKADYIREVLASVTSTGGTRMACRL